MNRPEGQIVTLQPLPVPLGARPDDDLMLLCAAGHRAAFEALVDRHLEGLCRFCTKLCGSDAIGDEVAQDVLVELWSRAAAYRPQGQFKSLLLRMARSRCLNQIRGRRRGEQATEVLGQADAAGAATPEATIDAMLSQERSRRLHLALVDLPVKLREAVLLRFDQELDYREIAKVTGTFESTARSRVFHALKKLQRQLAEEEV